MKRSLSLALLFVLGCATGGVASRAIPQARAGTAPQRWEYFCMDDARLDGLNQAGRAGWELVTMYETHNWDQVVCFKRVL